MILTTAKRYRTTTVDANGVRTIRYWGHRIQRKPGFQVLAMATPAHKRPQRNARNVASRYPRIWQPAGNRHVPAEPAVRSGGGGPGSRRNAVTASGQGVGEPGLLGTQSADAPVTCNSREQSLLSAPSAPAPHGIRQGEVRCSLTQVTLVLAEMNRIADVPQRGDRNEPRTASS